MRWAIAASRRNDSNHPVLFIQQHQVDLVFTIIAGFTPITPRGTAPETTANRPRVFVVSSVRFLDFGCSKVRIIAVTKLG
ncbi:hypothetical protein HMPREF0578_1162 [Mobiluncus mulieris 28-1]|uniref:Uncharacterized protein n=1 Tax=Mobiluncus mulieris TaxID=2052 RepID=A0A7Y0Y2Z2_9ACTO|nr:hypothetical protein HMPREF0577_0301 [Mobiluncus mulieris ATCC 35243]EEZ91917.1 hypothetical protein HMPREF0578_1162 [Mobiluncus mulieris 28-1]MCU9968385.1 hypothetical protein [Mobiluncus mulieris]MCU9970391.1 hypothetical protein [Mobiluncus mulieris]MCU9972617.1 hypothetical protein [Mobiluncus mulieris]